MTILSGTFVADNGEKCTVRGDKSNGLDRQLDMDIDCATQHIKMTGTADADGKHILGGFNAYHPDGQSSFHSLGDYKMARDK